MDELEELKYQIYKRSGKSDYLTFNQFRENQKVAYTFSELQNRENLGKSKKVKKDLKKEKKWLYNSCSLQNGNI